ncbi:hypothetical protein [Roseateles depolymerans]|uniref:hypothetical protein n=1 Tax=Roseateles depolymerans TaxID=76731 RepID=UPI00073DB04B|nr:hypothetical protein [Roseateles depolymerans]
MSFSLRNIRMVFKLKGYFLAAGLLTRPARLKYVYLVNRDIFEKGRIRDDAGTHHRAADMQQRTRGIARRTLQQQRRAAHREAPHAPEVPIHDRKPAAASR